MYICVSLLNFHHNLLKQGGARFHPPSGGVNKKFRGVQTKTNRGRGSHKKVQSRGRGSRKKFRGIRTKKTRGLGCNGSEKVSPGHGDVPGLHPRLCTAFIVISALHSPFRLNGCMNVLFYFFQSLFTKPSHSLFCARGRTILCEKNLTFCTS